MAHNGNLTNQDELTNELFKSDLRHINTNSDSEVLLNVIAHELQKLGKMKLTPEVLFKAMKRLYKRCNGAYAAVGMLAGYGMFGFRDPNGIRPLIYGSHKNKDGTTDYMIASESVALDALGFKIERDVKPGEIIYIDQNGNFHSKVCDDSRTAAPCIFEYVYLARPDSVIEGSLLYMYIHIAMGMIQDFSYEDNAQDNLQFQPYFY